MVFVGGGLAALQLLQELRTALPERVAVVDPALPRERTPVHWSYWSHEQTPYDRFAIGVWRRARVADALPEPITPFALRPLGFAPPRTTGPQHILLGTKRGLVKPSAGYGIVRIAEESKHLARMWREDRPPPRSWRSPWQWRLLDRGFLRLAARDPRLPLELLHRVMGTIPLAQSLRFIDEELPPGQLAPLLRSASPVMLRRGSRSALKGAP